MLSAGEKKGTARRSWALGENGNSRLAPPSQIAQTPSTRSWQCVDENNQFPPLPLPSYKPENAVHKWSESLTELPAAQSKRNNSLARNSIDHDTSQEHSASANFAGSRADTVLAATGDSLVSGEVKAAKKSAGIAAQKARIKPLIKKRGFTPVENDQDFEAELARIETPELLSQYAPIYRQEKPDWYGDIVDETTVLDHSQSTSFNYIRRHKQLDLEDIWFNYRPRFEGGTQGGQMASLDVVLLHPRQFYLGGLMSGSTSRVARARILEVKILFLEADESSIGEGHVFFQTEESKKHKVWYEVKAPDPAYQSYWDDSMWLLDFSTFIMQYCVTKAEGQVTFHAFKADFAKDMRMLLQGDELSRFDECLRLASKSDLGRLIARHMSFIKAVGESIRPTTISEEVEGQPIWAEMAPPPAKRGGRKAKTSTGASNEEGQKDASEKSEADTIEKTIVTPEVARIYRKGCPELRPDKYNLLEPVTPVPAEMARIEQRRQDLGLSNKLSYPQESHFRVIDGTDVPRTTFALLDASRKSEKQKFTVQDVVRKLVIIRQKSGRRRKRTQLRYAYVTRVAPQDQRVYVIWMLGWGETRWSEAFYPIGNELCFSDECCCESVSVDDIVESHNIALFQDHPDDPEGFFALATYRLQTQAFEDVNADQVLHKCLPCKVKEEDIKPSHPPPAFLSSKTRHISLFSGCGGLDHSMSEAGTIETILAIDTDQVAMLTHKANDASHNCKHITGSVCPPLKNHLLGKEQLPEADLISGGSPCEGFSAANRHAKSITAAKNRSLIATAISHLEANPPAYANFENVTRIDCNPKSNQNQGNYASVTMAAGHALSYQCRGGNIKISDCENGFTSRERFVFSFAAPGLKLPQVAISTDKPKPGAIWETFKTMAGGNICNSTTLNPANPDHVPLVPYKFDVPRRISILALVSKMEPGKNLRQMKEEGLLHEAEEFFFETLTKQQQSKSSKTLCRHDSTKEFPTITTILSWLDSFARLVHPDEDRAITLEEIRLVMGYPDSFAIFGDPLKALKQIGNSVPWALGKALRVALDKSRAEAETRRGEKRGREDEAVAEAEAEIDGLEDEIMEPPAKKRRLR